MSKYFSFDKRLNFSFIPFMPATILDDVETRIQIKRVLPNQALDVEVLVDGNAVISHVNYNCDDFALFKHVQKYSAGSHILEIRYKGNEEVLYDVETINFYIEENRKPLLQGGFVMLGPPNDRIPCANFCADTKKMTDCDWSNYVDELYKIGIHCIIVKVTVQLDFMGGKCTAHYQSSLYPRSDVTAKDPIRAILNAAEKNGQYVFIGLGHTFYGTLPNTIDVISELHDSYGDSPAFYGWYASEEANMAEDKDWVWKQWENIYRHVAKISPVKPLLISPYAYREEKPFDETDVLNPEFLEKLGNNQFACFDVIAPQDMVGHKLSNGRLTVKRATNMLKLLKTQVQKAKKHLWANCEAFDFNQEDVLLPRFENGGFDGENGYLQQIKESAPHVEKVITFMFNGFFAPPNYEPNMGGQEAVLQYENYLAYRNDVLKNGKQ